MSLTERIKQYRKIRGFSQEYMGLKLHLSQPAYSRLEKDETVCLQRLSAIAQVLGVVPQDLIGGCIPAGMDILVPADELPLMLLVEKEAIINRQREEIAFLKQQISFMQAAS